VRPGRNHVDLRRRLQQTRRLSGAERYAAFDLGSQTVVVHHEAMDVAWYATGGSFDADGTGRTADDSEVTSDNVWTAPSASGLVHLWVVLRDDRGGTGWAEYALDIR
jgi:hypothetical protein